MVATPQALISVAVGDKNSPTAASATIGNESRIVQPSLTRRKSVGNVHRGLSPTAKVTSPLRDIEMVGKCERQAEFFDRWIG